MNDCEFIGNLTKDPVIRNTKTGKAVASFSIATNRDYVTPQGEKKQLTDYVNVVAWGELASAVSQYLQKGKRVLVQGRQSTRSYDDQQGQLSQVNPYQPQGNGYPQQGAAPHGNSPDWGQFGQAAPQGSGNGKDEDIPF